MLTPVYRTPRKTLEEMLASVSAQTYEDWEHCLVDDNSAQHHVRAILDLAGASDPRVRVRHRDRQGGIVAATNDALKMARGEFVAFLDHDDELHPRALERMATAIAERPDADYLYSNEDKIDERAKHFEPFAKPGWSPDRLRSQMFVTHFRVIRRSLVEDLGGMREGFEGSQDWELALRVSERTERVVHVPEILYHWRALPGSAAAASDAKPWAHEASRRAVVDHVERLGIAAEVETIPGYPGHYWLRPALAERPLVSIVIPTAGRSRKIAGSEAPSVVETVRNVLQGSSYENYELIVVIDAGAPDAVGEQLGELAGDHLKLVGFGGPFNFSAKINLGVRESAGEQILLLNDDVELVPKGWRPARGHDPRGLPDWDTINAEGRRIWIESMLVYATQPGVGAVGAKLYLPDGRLQHGGIICREGRPAHPYYLGPGDTPGYAGNLLVASNYIAVTAACMMTPRTAFEAAGGFDEDLPLNYNDVDYCLKLHRSGLRSVMLPQVELLHFESLSRGEEPPATAEVEAMRQRWGDLLDQDPYYGEEFIDDDFQLPAYSRRGEFRSHTDPFSYLDRVRRAYTAGGVRLVAERTYGRMRRWLARRSQGATWRSSR
ncbi:MAG: glycosyltransferase family 2 protein [Solirubrobacterales bacterium]